MLGVGDPLGLLAAESHDWNTLVAIVQAADEISLDRQKGIADYTAGQTAKALAPLIRQLVKTVYRAASASRG